MKSTRCAVVSFHFLMHLSQSLLVLVIRVIRHWGLVEQEEMLQHVLCKVGILNAFLGMVRLEIPSLRKRHRFQLPSERNMSRLLAC
ncbi:unnamed protein product [Cuscuta campestris]|uniref:Uncharacterized protein n=1 Tax=Cuscuta campestris TaxID=132261 RepID=A0A484M650_9ASTE|nr:unnamed protein product [Cuscuta campestris]